MRTFLNSLGFLSVDLPRNGPWKTADNLPNRTEKKRLTAVPELRERLTQSS
jgi:hypothetical protein